MKKICVECFVTIFRDFGTKLPTNMLTCFGVKPFLLGITTHPPFKENRFVFIDVTNIEKPMSSRQLKDFCFR